MIKRVRQFFSVRGQMDALLTGGIAVAMSSVGALTYFAVANKNTILIAQMHELTGSYTSQIASIAYYFKDMVPGGAGGSPGSFVTIPYSNRTCVEGTPGPTLNPTPGYPNNIYSETNSCSATEPTTFFSSFTETTRLKYKVRPDRADRILDYSGFEESRTVFSTTSFSTKLIVVPPTPLPFTPSPTPTPSETPPPPSSTPPPPTNTPNPSSTPEASITPTPEPSGTPQPTSTPPVPTSTPTPTPTPTPSGTPDPSSTPNPSNTPDPSATPLPSPTPPPDLTCESIGYPANWVMDYQCMHPACCPGPNSGGPYVTSFITCGFMGHACCPPCNPPGIQMGLPGIPPENMQIGGCGYCFIPGSCPVSSCISPTERIVFDPAPPPNPCGFHIETDLTCALFPNRLIIIIQLLP